MQSKRDKRPTPSVVAVVAWHLAQRASMCGATAEASSKPE
jgi:hypothetical protein